MNTTARPIAVVLAISAAMLLAGCVPLFATGVAMGGVASYDRRSLGTQIEDQSIQLRGTQRVKEALPGSEEAYGYVTSYNRRVLLTGLAPTEKQKEQAEKLAASLENIKTIHNEIQVSQGGAAPSSLRDTSTTTRIRAALLQNDEIESISIKVVTEARTVYLLGIVTQAEGKRAAEVASKVPGVEKVVTLFDYISDQELSDLQRQRAAQGKSAAQ